jgi:copper chaperone
VTQIYRVAGMSCQGCMRAVTQAIQRRSPGAGISVDLDKGLVTVAGEVAPTAVVDAVTEAGFTFEGVVETPA